jgi:hypothetical protein
VVYDEGLRSYRAIAFIKSNPNLVNLKMKSYLSSGALLLQGTVLAKQRTFRGFFRNLGEKLWIN